MKETAEVVELDWGYLGEILRYDPQTGSFTWLVSLSNRAPVGSVAGVIAKNGYRYIAIDGRKHLAHRLAWFYVHGVWPADQIDHIDCVRSNNALSNLREANTSNNAANGLLRSTNKSGYKGVSWDAEKRKWVAGVKKNYKRHVLGRFDDPYEAHLAYVAGANRLHGEFAREG